MNETKEQKKKRIQEEKAAAEERKRQYRLEQQAKKDRESCAKDDYFASFMHIQVNAGKGFDSHTVSVLMVFRPGFCLRKKFDLKRRYRFDEM